MLALWLTPALLVAALATASVLTWRRHAHQPVRAEIPENCGCTPQIKRQDLS